MYTADGGQSVETDREFLCTETNQVFVVSCWNSDAMLSIAVICYVMNQSGERCGQYLLPVWSEFACELVLACVQQTTRCRINRAPTADISSIPSRFNKPVADLGIFHRGDKVGNGRSREFQNGAGIGSVNEGCTAVYRVWKDCFQKKYNLTLKSVRFCTFSRRKNAVSFRQGVRQQGVRSMRGVNLG